MTIRVNANLFRIAHSVASTEETRYYLNGVFVEPHPCGGVLLTATDGHRLLTVYDREGHAVRPLILRQSKESERLSKPGKKDGGRILKFEAPSGYGPVMAEFSIKASAEVIGTARMDVIDGTYPDYRRAVPRYLPETGSPANFSPIYIESFAKVARELAAESGFGRGMIRIATSDSCSAALIHFEVFPDAFGVLMPMRGGDRTNVPDWLDAQGNPEYVLSALWEPHPGRPAWGFSLSYRKNEMAEANPRTFNFESREAAVRAYNRVLASLRERGHCLTVEFVAQEGAEIKEARARKAATSRLAERLMGGVVIPNQIAA